MMSERKDRSVTWKLQQAIITKADQYPKCKQRYALYTA